MADRHRYRGAGHKPRQVEYEKARNQQGACSPHILLFLPPTLVRCPLAHKVDRARLRMKQACASNQHESLAHYAV